MHGQYVKTVFDLAIRQLAQERLQPRAAATPPQHSEHHAGVVHAESHDLATELVTVRLAAVHEGQHLFVLDVFLDDGLVLEAREVQHAIVHVSEPKIAGRVAFDRDHRGVVVKHDD